MLRKLRLFYISDPELRTVYERSEGRILGFGDPFYLGTLAVDIKHNINRAVSLRVLMSVLSTWDSDNLATDSTAAFYRESALTLINQLGTGVRAPIAAMHSGICYDTRSNYESVQIGIGRMQSYYAGLQRQYALFARDQLGMTEAEITAKTRFQF